MCCFAPGNGSRSSCTGCNENATAAAVATDPSDACAQPLHCEQTTCSRILMTDEKSTVTMQGWGRCTWGERASLLHPKVARFHKCLSFSTEFPFRKMQWIHDVVTADGRCVSVTTSLTSQHQRQRNNLSPLPAAPRRATVARTQGWGTCRRMPGHIPQHRIVFDTNPYFPEGRQPLPSGQTA